MKDKVQNILNSAVYAPSGDNSQPWDFAWNDNTLFIYNLSSKDNPVFNFEQRGSFVAHGALLENLVLLSKKNGLDARIKLFPDEQEKHLIATVEFNPASTTESDILSDYITERQTNRKAYEQTPLKPEDQAKMLELYGQNAETNLLFSNHDSLAKIGSAVSKAELFMLNYKPLHDYFFSIIRWTEKEEKQYNSGLYLKTLELLPVQIVIFKLYSKWLFAKILNFFGMANLIAKENSKIYSNSASFIAITSKNTDKTNFISVGRSLQRLWLSATVLGLNIQPVGGVLYLAQRIKEEGITGLNKDLLDMIIVAEQEIINSFNLNQDKILMLVRIGYGNKSSAKSSRIKPLLK